MQRLVALIVLAGALALDTSAAHAEDVIYVPAGFPSVCAQSLTNGVSYCPDGVSREATAFCRESLPNLKRWVSQKGLPFCGARGSGATGFDQVLLVDDRSLPASLSRLLEPVASDGRVFEKSGPFRDEDRIIRSVWVIGEGGGSPGSGGNSGGTTDTGGGGTSSTGGTSGGTTNTGGSGTSSIGGTSGSNVGTGGSSGTGGETQQNSGSNGPTGGDNTEQRNDESSGTSTCRPGDQEYVEDIERFTVEFRKDYLQFRTLVGQALSRYMVTSRAHQFAGASQLLRQYHAKLLQNRVAEGAAVPITAQIKRRSCDRRVESVDFPGLPQGYGG